MKGLGVLILGCTLVSAQTVARFSADGGDSSTSAYSVGPFPTNADTVQDSSQPTGIRVNLASSNDNCSAEPAPACGFSQLLDQLDGFSVNARVMACFTGPVDMATLPSALLIVPVGQPSAEPVGVDRVIWDPATHCAYAKPAHVLLQRTSYLLAVTNALRNGGKPVAVSPDFKTCLATHGPYCASLEAAITDSGLPKPSLLSASLFTTMSVTGWMQQAQLVTAALPAFAFPAGAPSYFPLASIKSLTYSMDQSSLPPTQIPTSVLSGVSGIYFGLFVDPSYLNTTGVTAGTITTSPLQPIGFNVVSFHVFLPAAHAKTPVVIYIHGSGDTQFGAPTFIASTLAKAGFATLAFELQGHGFGPASTVAVTTDSGATTYEYTPGRGVAIPPGQPISSESGCIVPGPIGVRDCVRQNAVDLFALVHLLQQTDGLGLNLNPRQIYVIGQSLGAITASVALPELHEIPAAVLNGDGGSTVDIARLSPVSLTLADDLLASIGNPELLNVADGAAPPAAPYNLVFNDNYVFSGEPPVANTVPYALHIQAAFEASEWLNMLGDPLAFGPYLKAATRPLFQFGIGDLEVPNPAETAAVRAANAKSDTWILNFPTAVAIAPELATIEDPSVPGLPILPHRVLANPTIFSAASERSLSLAEQDEVAAFLSSNGRMISDPNRFLTLPFDFKNRIFIRNPLPMGLNYMAQ